MDKKDDEFLRRIKETFRIEAEEHLRVLSSGLIELEKTRSKKRSDEIVESLFREIHSLKGAARSVDRKEIESVCHPVESLFSAMKRHEISLSSKSFDILFKAVTGLSKLLSSESLVQSSNDRLIQNELIRELKAVTEVSINDGGIEGFKPVPEYKPPEPSEPSASGTELKPGNIKIPGFLNPEAVRIPISKLDPLLFQAEEMIQTKVTLDQRIKELKEINNGFILWNKVLQIQKGHISASSETLWNELADNNKTVLDKLEFQLAELIRSMELDQHNLNRMVNDHLEEMKQVLMLPVSYLVESFPLMVRDICREQNKKVEFIIRGAEMEIDKRILDELKDPLIHLIRNSIDHGIGNMKERSYQNKPPAGRISLNFASPESGIVEITVSDDGKGINTEQVLKATVKSGYLSGEAAEKIGPEEILPLIFHSGVSTSSIITDISGRGLGLSIVHEKIEKLNGSISVETEPGKGTSFHIRLPMSLATFRSVMVRTKGFLFLIPAVNVERVLKVKADEIKTVEDQDTVCIDNRVLSVEDLGGVLGLQENKNLNSEGKLSVPENSNRIHLAVLVSGDYRVAFKVDEIIDEMQILVKGLGKLLKSVRNISGTTVLGTGKIVPILNISDLIKSALMFKGKFKDEVSVKMKTDEIKKILVAEDSITARTLIKNILETAGYKVTTAVDGKDAFTLAREGEFDLVVSDIDMPRMNGFELTSKIRNDKRLSDIPLILITALESREDRERGIEVGADAYIIKSSFDQTNLLEIIKKLI